MAWSGVFQPAEKWEVYGSLIELQWKTKDLSNAFALSDEPVVVVAVVALPHRFPRSNGHSWPMV